MSDTSQAYQPQEIEDKWYSIWTEKDFFSSKPDDRESYTVVIPPPNVTGVLHMGHMLNNTIQDVLVRRARMLGYNACWVPGTDHASIATEAKVVEKLRNEGIEKHDLSREEFLKHAWEWTEKHGGIILDQLKKLGASCDWKRTRFTMEESLSDAVLDVFEDLYKKGYIYRGIRMINWDPQAQTALSDEEVVYKEVDSKLYHIQYRIEGTDDFVTVATTRPETILGDTAICVNPKDDRFQHLKDKRALIPLIDRSIPIIFDEYVDMEFGTGALKITPAHDPNDYEIGIKHNLESINILNDDGTLNEAATLYVGEDRFEVRKKIAIELDQAGALEKEENHANKVGFSERTHVPIEPKISIQWFCKMEKLAKPALDNVMNDNVRFHPPKFKNSYRHWMENVKDWCISRQLWWGHRIPAYYFGNGLNDYVVARSEAEAIEMAREKSSNPNLQIGDLRQDEDALDTWFSSWLWPISVFDGFKDPQNEDINYYYPTCDLVTAPEIMFFWVARMIMAGYEYKGEKPFNNVYYTGIVRDKQRRKMSKSLGNSPEPLELIKQYGADGVRVGMLLSSPAGNDLLFDEYLCEQGRNFCNKIWNAQRLVKSWKVAEGIETPAVNTIAANWFENKLNQTIAHINDLYKEFRISDVLMHTYKLVWDDFCSWYLEMVKPKKGEPMDQQTYEATVSFFESLLKLLHPFTPFISEEIWHQIRDRKQDDYITIAEWPTVGAFDKAEAESFKTVEDVVGKIRGFRKEYQVSFSKPIDLLSADAGKKAIEKYEPVIMKLGNVERIGSDEDKKGSAFTFISGTSEFHIPYDGFNANAEEQKQKLLESLSYYKGFLQSVSKKLSNENFVKNAPSAVVEKEQQKQTDAEAKIKILESQLENMD